MQKAKGKMQKAKGKMQKAKGTMSGHGYAASQLNIWAGTRIAYVRAFLTAWAVVDVDVEVKEGRRLYRRRAS